MNACTSTKNVYLEIKFNRRNQVDDQMWVRWRVSISSSKFCPLIYTNLLPLVFEFNLHTYFISELMDKYKIIFVLFYIYLYLYRNVIKKNAKRINVYNSYIKSLFLQVKCRKLKFNISYKDFE